MDVMNVLGRREEFQVLSEEPVLPRLLRVANTRGRLSEAKRLTPYIAKSFDGVDRVGSDGVGTHPPTLLMTMRYDDDGRHLGAQFLP